MYEKRWLTKFIHTYKPCLGYELQEKVRNAIIYLIFFRQRTKLNQKNRPKWPKETTFSKEGVGNKMK